MGIGAGALQAAFFQVRRNFSRITAGKAGRYEEALESFGHALEINPGDAETRYAKGLIFSKLGEHEKALECFDSLIKENPKYIAALEQKALSLAKLGKHEEALECIEVFLRKAPGSETARSSWRSLPASFRGSM